MVRLNDGLVVGGEVSVDTGAASHDANTAPVTKQIAPNLVITSRPRELRLLITSAKLMVPDGKNPPRSPGRRGRPAVLE